MFGTIACGRLMLISIHRYINIYNIYMYIIIAVIHAAHVLYIHFELSHYRYEENISTYGWLMHITIGLY